MAHRCSCFAARGIFLHYGSNLWLLRWQADSSPLSHQGTPICHWILSLISSHVSTFCLPYTLVPCNKTDGIAQQSHWKQGLLPPRQSAIEMNSKWASPSPLPGSLKAMLAEMDVGCGYPGVVEETHQNWLYKSFYWDWLFWCQHFPSFIHPCCPASINSGGCWGVHGITCIQLCASVSLSLSSLSLSSFYSLSSSIFLDLLAFLFLLSSLSCLFFINNFIIMKNL